MNQSRSAAALRSCDGRPSILRRTLGALALGAAVLVPLSLGAPLQEKGHEGHNHGPTGGQQKTDGEKPAPAPDK
jgi:hypothetical protein